MITFALMFPGQGAQFPGMAQRAHDGSARVRDLFELAEGHTGLPLRRICFDATRAEQSRADLTQPAVFLASLAVWWAAQEDAARHDTDLRPACVAGHSLGHFTALVAAGVVDVPTGLALVHRRALLMHEANQGQPGQMATVIGLSAPRVREVLAEVGNGVTVAAINGPDQVVISGRSGAVTTAAEAVQRAGAERVVPLHIGLGAHSTLMADAAEKFTAEFLAMPLSRPSCPVVLNTNGALTDDVMEIRRDLLTHMCAPVQWWTCVTHARDDGRTRLVDVGPGRTLTKMLRRDLPDSELHALDQPRGLAGLLG